MASEADTSDSGFSDSKPDKPDKARTKPRCKKCRNHNIDSPLYQHKRYCPFKDCDCRLCITTTSLRDVMARQTKCKRSQQQDEVNGIPFEKRAPVEIEPALPVVKAISRKRSLTPSSMSSCDATESAYPMVFKDDKRDIIHDARRLIEAFRAPSSVLPLAFTLILQLEDYDKALAMILEVEKLLLEKARRRFLSSERQSVFALNPNVQEAHSNSLRYSRYTNSPDSSGAIPLIYDKNKKSH